MVVTTDNRRYGHVAYVEQVEATRILVSEMNYEKIQQGQPALFQLTALLSADTYIRKISSK